MSDQNDQQHPSSVTQQPAWQSPAVEDTIADQNTPSPQAMDVQSTPVQSSSAQSHSAQNDAVPNVPTAPEKSQDIADQNIFEMLGVTDGTPEQREQFLDELQAVIWDDFIENDTKLLLTDEEQVELRKILDPDPKSMENQEKAVSYLEKLVPDLEEIMLEKALMLKEEMARERLRALQELHRNDAEKSQQLAQVQQLMDDKQWYSATSQLNSL